MEKENYLEELKNELLKHNKDNEFINRCMQYAERLFKANLPVIFDRVHLALLLGIKYAELSTIINCEYNYYTEYNIAKKSGGQRIIQSPALILKYIQRWILDNILNNLHVSKYANGFCKNKSIVTNAIVHTNKDCVINIDIKDFFPSIDQESIFRIFYYYGYSKDISYVLSKLCTFEGYLPQGSPASPALSNIVCLKLDKRISSLSKKYKCDYTRYADDISISGNKGIKNILNMVTTIINDEGFDLNDKKTRISYKNQRQEVTGLIVNNKVTVPKKYKKELEQEIYYCIKYGVSDHLSYINCNKSFYKEHLYGKVYFVNSIEPELGKKLLKQLEKISWDY
jgi:Retron-type reverse transcriptase